MNMATNYKSLDLDHSSKVHSIDETESVNKE